MENQQTQQNNPQEEILTIGDFMAESQPKQSAKEEIVSLDSFMGNKAEDTSLKSIVSPVPETDKPGFIKSMAMLLYGGALEGATSFNQLIGLGAFEKTRELFIEPGQKEAQSIREKTFSESPIMQFTNDFAYGLGNLGITLPLDVMTGGATKTAIATKTLPKIEMALSRIPDFAIGAGIRGFVKGAEEGKTPVDATGKAIVGGAENLAFGIAYGEAGIGWKGILKMGALGAGSAVYEAAKDGRPPSKDEMIKGSAEGAAYGVIFSIIPHLRESTKIGSEKKVLGEYEKTINGYMAEGEFIKAKDTIDTMLSDEKIRPEIRDAMKEAITPEQPKLAENIAKSEGNWEVGQERPFVFDPNSTKNEGRFRLYPPDELTDYFRRKSTTEGVSYVMGKDKDGNSVIQAIRFDKFVMSEEKAAKWWEENKGKYQFAEKGIEPKAEKILPEKDPIERLSKLLEEAKPLRSKLESKYTKERAKRIAEVERALETGGEQGYIKALSKLKGELAPGEKAVFEPLKEKLSQKELDALYDKTFKHPYLDNWEKINAASGLTKLLSGELPQPKQLVLMEEVYGSNLISKILAKRAMGLKIADVALDIANIPRAILASADMSGFLRQGVIYVASHPKIAAGAMGKTFQFAFSQKAFDQYFKDLPKDPLYNLMRKSNLAITDPSKAGLSRKEEAFMSRLMEKIPILGSVLRFSERSYVGFLNKLRVDVFKTFSEEYLSRGKSPVKDEELFKATAEMVNTFTGRGDMGKANRIGPVLNTVFFSPRLITARFNTLNPVWYANLPKEVRVKAIGDFGKFVTSGLTIIALASLWKDEGVEVESDPRSSDFGKIKIGNTRFDIWAGFQQWARVFSQVITGQRKSASTGEIVSLTKEEYPFTTRKEVILRFVEGKFAPVPSLINEVVSGNKTFGGDDLTPEIAIKEKIIPMYIQDIADAYEDGGFGRAVGAGASAFFGIGVQTYEQKKSKKYF